MLIIVFNYFSLPSRSVFIYIQCSDIVVQILNFDHFDMYTHAMDTKGSFTCMACQDMCPDAKGQLKLLSIIVRSFRGSPIAGLKPATF